MHVTMNNVVATFLNDLKINILESGHAYCDSDWNQINRKLPVSRLYYFLKGEGEIIHNNRHISLKPGSLCFIPFDLRFECICGEYMEKIYFHINIPFLEKLDLFEGYDDVIILPCDNAEKISDLYDSNNLSDIFKLKQFIYNDIIRIIDYSNNINTNIFAYSNIVYRAITYINENISSQLKIRDIAAELYISESRLSKLFRSELGITIGKYIHNKLIMDIEHLLMTSNMSTTEICEKFNFCDRSYFIRFFKNNTGVSPSQYKKNFTNNSIIVTSQTFGDSNITSE